MLQERKAFSGPDDQYDHDQKRNRYCHDLRHEYLFFNQEQGTKHEDDHNRRKKAGAKNKAQQPLDILRIRNTARQKCGTAESGLVLGREAQDLFVAVTHHILPHPARDPPANPCNQRTADRHQRSKNQHSQSAVHNIVHITCLYALVYDIFHLPGQSEELCTSLHYNQ